MKDPRPHDGQNFERIKRKRAHGPRTRTSFLNKCNGKNSYRTKHEADDVLKGLTQTVVTYPLYVYECPYYLSVPVRHWHLTHAPRRRRS